MKYAFTSGNNNPALKIDCHRVNNHVNVSFKDNGIGLDHDTGDGMGLSLIQKLSKQIGGKLVVANDKGFEIDLEFPV